MKIFHKENFKYLILLFVYGAIGLGSWFSYAALERRLAEAESMHTLSRSLVVLMFLTGCSTIVVIWLTLRRVDQLYVSQKWLIDVARVQGAKLSMVDQSVPVVIPPVDDGKNYSPHWPWGNHHTETLGHLEAAARRFWVLYDPSDPGTAPTNDMVSEWLRTERNISKEKARAIASMLRPDGLPTGPRT